MKYARLMLLVMCLLVPLALAGCSDEEETVVVHDYGHWSNLQASGVFKDLYNHYAKGGVENVAAERSPAVSIKMIFLNNNGRSLCEIGVWVGEIEPGETLPFEAVCGDYTSQPSVDWTYEVYFE